MDKDQPTKAQLAEKFMSGFNQNRDGLSSQIENLSVTCSGGDSGTIVEKLNDVSNGIQKMSKSLHDAMLFLPSYSIKVRQNEIRDLEKALKEQEDILIPKKKFGFKKKIPSVVDGSEAETKSKSVDSSRVVPNPVETVPEISGENFLTIEKLKDTTVVYGEYKLNGIDVLLRDFENVTLHLIGSPSTLRIKNVKNSLIICGPVITSVFVDSVVDSKLFLSCKQLRTHSSKGVDVYLRVLSRAIIEDCEDIRFAPYFWSHPKSEELHKKAEIPHDLERYNAVDDFNWLSATQSPNWSILPEAERTESPNYE